MDKSSIDQFNKYLSECIELSKQMHKKMSTNENIKNIGGIVSPHKGSFCFHIVIPKNKYDIFKVSCSVPLDAYSLTHEPVYETALLDAYGDIMSNTLWYDDICRFETVEQVIAEILDVINGSQN